MPIYRVVRAGGKRSRIHEKQAWRARRTFGAVLALSVLASCSEGELIVGDRVPDGSVTAVTRALPLNTISNDRNPSATGDLLELYFRANRGGGLGGGEIWRSVRSSRTMPWSEPTLVAGLSDPARDRGPEISPDGLSLFFATERGGTSSLRLWTASRASRSESFVVVGPLPGLEDVVANHPTVTEDGQLLIFASDTIPGSEGLDLYESRRGGAGAWSVAVRLDAISLADDDTSPCISRDGLVIYFTRAAADTPDDSDVYRAVRPSRDEAFGDASRLEHINSAASDTEPWFSVDERYVLFASDREGQYDLFESSR